MKKYGIVCPYRKANPYRRMMKASKEHTIVSNFINREFKQDIPYKVLLTDITYLSYKNGKKALSEIYTRLTHGVYGLLGPKGAGTSTQMNNITDNLRPTAGEVSLDGNVIWKNSNAYRARLGYMPQQQGLYSSFTGTRFLWYMAALKGLSHREA